MTGARRSRGIPGLPEFTSRRSASASSLASGVSMGTDQLAASINTALTGVSNRLGKMADAAAIDIAKREGAIAGLDPEFRPTGRQTSAGRAFDQAALRTHGERLDTMIRQRAQAVFDANPDNPVALQQGYAQLQTEILGELDRAGPDGAQSLRELVPGAQALISRLQLSDGRQVARNLKTKRDGEERVALSEGLQERTNSMVRMAYQLGLDPLADDVLAKEMTALTGFLAEAGPAGGGVISAERQISLANEATGQILEARVRGAFDRLAGPDERLNLVADLEQQWLAGEGPMKELDADKVGAFIGRLKRQATHEKTAAERVSRTEKQAMRQAIADDVASVASTGEPLETGLTFDQVKEKLGEADAIKWERDRGTASAFHSAVGDMGQLTARQITARVEALDPVPGAEGFERAERLQQDVLREAGRILSARVRDPATAVTQFPEVAAIQATHDPNDPASWRELISARLTAQAALEIPELNFKVLTEAEAMNAAKGLPRDLTAADAAQSMRAYSAHLASRYGEFADEVMVQVMRQRGVDRQVAKTASAMLTQAMRGERTTVSDQAGLDTAREVAAGDRAMEGQGPAATANATDAVFPRPKARHIDLLIANPGFAQQFDEKFGPGQAELYLSRARQTAEQRQLNPDGSLSVPEDGGIATLNPDGSENWEPVDGQ